MSTTGMPPRIFLKRLVLPVSDLLKHVSSEDQAEKNEFPILPDTMLIYQYYSFSLRQRPSLFLL